MNPRRLTIPPIKCQGIKTKLTPWIRSIVPPDFEGRWIEPFMGSGVVAFNIRPKSALLADSNPHLINMYQAISNGDITPASARQFLEAEGDKLRRSDGERYYVVRERFNKYHDPLDFLFLNRSCFNGMIRFNRKNEFNVPFCRKPDRFSKSYVSKICNQIQAVSDILRFSHYEFVCQDFSDTIRESNDQDLIYCDPPYIGRHTDYFNDWNEDLESALAKTLSSLRCKFILSTWHSNQFRENGLIESVWSGYNILTRAHFYHVGAKEKNRNPILEALITNFPAKFNETPKEVFQQTRLLEDGVEYEAL